MAVYPKKVVTSSSRAKSGNSVIIDDEVVRLAGLDLDDRAEAKWQSLFVRSIFFSVHSARTSHFLSLDRRCRYRIGS